MTIALARKYRPRTLRELIGQERTVKSIADSITQKKLHHAYIFFGTRGIGKTSIARIIAKSINCNYGPTKEPCQQCISCKEIDEGCFIDLIEVDAASNAKVDEFRDLLEDTSTSPAKGRYKIYIIDEVHMLSKYSFNALLKTLEEPPKHCIFILATTSIKQVPATILSRCLRFPLKSISNSAIAARLVEILKKENVNFDVEGVRNVATAARGSMRDALSLLEQASTYGEKTVFGKDVKKILGIIDKMIVIYLLKALHYGNREQLLKITQNLSSEGVDFSAVISDFINVLHKIAVIQAIPEAVDKKNDIEIVLLAREIPRNNVHIYYQIAITGKYDLIYSISPDSAFEMLLLRMLALTPPVEIKKSKIVLKKDNTLGKNVFCPKSSKSQFHPWLDLINKINLTGSEMVLAQHCKLLSIDKLSVKLTILKKYEHLLKYKQRIENVIRLYCKQSIELCIEVDKSKTQKGFHLKQLNEENVNEILERFDAKIV